VVFFGWSPDKAVYTAGEKFTVTAYLDTSKLPPSRCVYGAIQLYLWDSAEGEWKPGKSSHVYRAYGGVSSIGVSEYTPGGKYTKFRAYAVFVDADGVVRDSGWSEVKYTTSMPKHWLQIRVYDSATGAEITDRPFSYRITGRTTGLVYEGTAYSGFMIQLWEDTYDVEVAVEGYEPASQSVSLTADRLLEFHLGPAAPNADVTGVLLDSTEVPEGGEVEVRPGQYTVSVEVRNLGASGTVFARGFWRPPGTGTFYQWLEEQAKPVGPGETARFTWTAVIDRDMEVEVQAGYV